MTLQQSNFSSVWSVLSIFVIFGIASAQERSESSVQRYAEAIASAQADLDAGKIAEAREKLAATEKTMRSFEYHYLTARSEAASSEGPAPQLIRVLKSPQVESRYGLLNPMMRQVAFICRDGSVRVIDLTDLTSDADAAAAERVVKSKSGSPIWSGVFSGDGKSFAAGFQNGEVVVWDAQTWEVRATVPLSEKPVREIALAPDGTAFAAEGNSALELWSLVGAEPKKVADVGERYNFGEGLAFSPKGDLIATGGMFDIHLHNAKTGERLQSIKHASYTMGLEFSADGSRIASAPRGNVNKFLAVFDVAKREMLFNAGPFPCYVHGGVFTADGKRAISTACEKVPQLQLFDTSTGTVMFSIDRSVTGAKPAVTHDGLLMGWTEQNGYHYIDLKKPDGK